MIWDKDFINKVICGDSEEISKEIPDNSIDLIATDPPYGIAFMGRDWDKAIPSINIWRECFRVLKPGAFAFIMSGPRQDCLWRMMARLEEAGFMIDFTSIYWVQAQGFPKAMNMSKAIDKRAGVEREIIGEKFGGLHMTNIMNDDGWKGERPGERVVSITIPATPEAKKFDGSYAGFQPKPAVEVILVVMKPLSEKTYIDQALNNGKGITWLGDCMIPYENKDDIENTKRKENRSIETKRVKNGTSFQGTGKFMDTKGRFPANLLVEDDALNNGEISKSGTVKEGNLRHSNSLFGIGNETQMIGYNDSGSFSRYFSLDAWWEERVKELPEAVQKTFPFLIVPKPNKEEKNLGCEELPLRIGGGMKGTENLTLKTGSGNIRNNKMKNHHPTVKPIKLFSDLITIGSREDDIVLDPFCGSGTTLLSAEILNRRYIGIELNPEYCEIAEKRLGYIKKHKENNLF